MMLSPSLVGTLRTFNQMDPATRSGMLPVRDGAAFGEKVLTMTPPQAHPAPAGPASLQDSSNSLEAEVLAAHREQADAPLAPKAAHPLEGEVGNPVDPRLWPQKPVIKSRRPGSILTLSVRPKRPGWIWADDACVDPQTAASGFWSALARLQGACRF